MLVSTKTTEARILLIQTGTPPEAIREHHDDLAIWFRCLLKRWSNKIDVVRVFEGEVLPEPELPAIVIITGSWSMVTEYCDWSEYTAEWIRKAFKIGVPMFGVCYGHQLMAYALGGHVGWHSQGREVGCKEVRLNHLAESDPLLVNAPKQFPAHLTHMQTIIDLPLGAVVLASSDQDRCQIVKYNECAYSTQFHPEFTQNIARSLILYRKKILDDEGISTEALLNDLTDTRDASNLLIMFVEMHIN
ncbi:glutamine amidotransferase [Vibrio cholerae]|nr:glutamine amidotransferase [Vibrio cholerae]